MAALNATNIVRKKQRHEARFRSETSQGFRERSASRVPTWKGGALVANYSHSDRAPSLEELYNNGPHPGNLAFEIGDPNLKREIGNGLDFGVRHSSNRLRLEANGFYYRINNFIFLAPVDANSDGEVDTEDDLIVAEYSQGTSRYSGLEASLDAQLHRQYGSTWGWIT